MYVVWYGAQTNDSGYLQRLLEEDADPAQMLEHRMLLNKIGISSDVLAFRRQNFEAKQRLQSADRRAIEGT